MKNRPGNLISRRQAIFSLAALTAGAFIKPTSLLAADEASTPKYRFAVIGDWGTGDQEEFDLAKKIFETYQKQSFDCVLTVGDNIYPDGNPKLMKQKFEQPFAELIEAKVPFYASLGNHDVEKGRDAQINYPLFNMNGKNYYVVSKANGLVDFFLLDSTRFDEAQEEWLVTALSASTAKWKMAFFHHPLYSSGKKHGSQDELRRIVEPIFIQYGVRVVFQGHDHFYERSNIQKGIQYFVTGGGGKLRKGGLDLKSSMRAASYDLDNHFMLLDIDEKEFCFKAISRTGGVVDEGTVKKVLAASQSAGAL
jgi:3',5'-cyclic AMP phosphodiesterase CpdA